MIVNVNAIVEILGFRLGIIEDSIMGFDDGTLVGFLLGLDVGSTCGLCDGAFEDSRVGLVDESNNDLIVGCNIGLIDGFELVAGDGCGVDVFVGFTEDD